MEDKEKRTQFRKTLLGPTIRLACIPTRAKECCSTCGEEKIALLHISEHPGILIKVFKVIEAEESISRIAGLDQTQL